MNGKDLETPALITYYPKNEKPAPRPSAHSISLKPVKDANNIEFVWCLVGNVVKEHPYGVEKETRTGSKHFQPGAKVYCFPPKWGDGYEKIKVCGVPRKSQRFITVIMNSKLVTNWRLQKVYKRYVVDTMIIYGGWDETDFSKKRIESMISRLSKKM